MTQSDYRIALRFQQRLAQLGNMSSPREGMYFAEKAKDVIGALITGHDLAAAVTFRLRTTMIPPIQAWIIGTCLVCSCRKNESNPLLVSATNVPSKNRYAAELHEGAVERVKKELNGLTPDTFMAKEDTLMSDIARVLFAFRTVLPVTKESAELREDRQGFLRMMIGTPSSREAIGASPDLSQMLYQVLHDNLFTNLDRLKGDKKMDEMCGGTLEVVDPMLELVETITRVMKPESALIREFSGGTFIVNICKLCQDLPILEQNLVILRIHNCFQRPSKLAEPAAIIISHLIEALLKIEPSGVQEPHEKPKGEIFNSQTHEWIFSLYSIVFQHACPEALVHFVLDGLQPCLKNHVAIGYERQLVKAFEKTKEHLEKVNPPFAFLLGNIDL